MESRKLDEVVTEGWRGIEGERGSEPRQPEATSLLIVSGFSDCFCFSVAPSLASLRFSNFLSFFVVFFQLSSFIFLHFLSRLISPNVLYFQSVLPHLPSISVFFCLFQSLLSVFLSLVSLSLRQPSCLREGCWCRGQQRAVQRCSAPLCSLCSLQLDTLDSF